MKDGLLRRFKLGTWAAVAVAAVVVAGCGGGGGSTASDDGSDAKPVAGGTLNIAEIEEVTGFAPAEAIGTSTIHMIGQVMEPLLQTNAKSELEPWLARSYSESPNHLKFTINLRPGVKFSDGKPMTAEDVVFSLDTVRKSANWSFMFESIRSIQATSPDAVVITLNQPDAALPAKLSIYAANIVPRDFGGKTEKEFAQNPVGTGAFEMSDWKPGQSITFTRNPNYWRSGEPSLDEFVVHTVTDDNSRVAQLRANELEAVEAPPFSMLADLENSPGLQAKQGAWGTTFLMVLNSSSPAFENPRAREAVYLALDREGIVEAATNGYGRAAGSWLASAVPDWKEIKPPAQNVAKAKELLAEAVQEGTKPSFTMLVWAGSTFWSTVSQIVQRDLEEIGFTVELQPLDGSAMTEKVLGGEAEAGQISLASDIPDMSELTSLYVATNGMGTGAPTDRIKSIEEQASREFDPTKRRQLFYESQQVIADEHFLIPLVEQPYIWALADDVVGLDTNLTGRPTLSQTGFSE